MYTDQRSSANNIQNEKFANESNGRNPKKDQGSEKSFERILVSYFPNHIEESVSFYQLPQCQGTPCSKQMRYLKLSDCKMSNRLKLQKR